MESRAKSSCRNRTFIILPLLVVCSILPAAEAAQLVSVCGSSFKSKLGGSGDSGLSIISKDGRYVLFASTANNLTLTNNNNSVLPCRFNVFLRDSINNTTTLVSAAWKHGHESRTGWPDKFSLSASIRPSLKMSGNVGREGGKAVKLSRYSQAGSDSSLFADVQKQLDRRHDGNAERLFGVQQIAVIGNDELCASAQSTSKVDVVLQIAAPLLSKRRWPHEMGDG
jgi:hypothetical protein